MYFRIIADATFKAENIDDAFLKLEQHFAYLQDTDREDPQLIESGQIKIRKEPK